MLITPEVGGRSFECCEVVTVNQNGNGSRVWLQNGDTITYATVNAAAMAALVVNDNGDPILYGPIASPTFGGNIYVSPQNTAQMRQTGAVPPATLMTFAGGPVNVVLSALQATLVAAFNLVARCGPQVDPPPVQTGYANAGDYTPGTLGGGPGNTNTVIGDGGTFARVGQLANAGEPDAGDTVTLGIKVRTQVTPTNIISISFNDGLPAPIDGARIAITVTPEYVSGTEVTSWEVESAADNQFVVKGFPATVGALDANLDIVVVYSVAGV